MSRNDSIHKIQTDGVSAMNYVDAAQVRATYPELYIQSFVDDTGTQKCAKDEIKVQVNIREFSKLQNVLYYTQKLGML